MAGVAGERRTGRFGLGAAWAAAMAGAILLWTGVAALAPRAEQGQIVSLDTSGGTLTLERVHPAGAGPRTFAVPKNLGVQRFDEQLSVGDLRPGQWVEMSVRTAPGTDPTVTSIRIVRGQQEPGPAREAETSARGDARCEEGPTASGSSRG